MSARGLESPADVVRWLDAALLDVERAGARGAPGAFGLARSAAALEALGRPDRGYRVVHVAGTKGKGTTAAGLASVLDRAGLRVGLYTSPHLVSVRERVRVGPGPVDDAVWVAAARDVAATPGADALTWFERGTLLALAAFRRAGAQVVVLEAGLGGRLDATNVVDKDVAVLTRIARDHAEVLGATVALIAGEKAAILAAGADAVLGCQDPVAEAVAAAAAAALGVVPWTLGRDLHARATAPARAAAPAAEAVAAGEPGDGATRDPVGAEVGRAGAAWSERDGAALARALAAPLRVRVETPRGAFEVAARVTEAAAPALALAAGAAWRLALRAPGLLPQAALEGALAPGLARLRWRGRWDVLAPAAAGEPVVVVDGAHDEASLRGVVAAARARLDRPPVGLFALARDKDLAPCLDSVAALGGPVVCCRAASPRARDPAELATGLCARGVDAEVAPDAAAGLARARARAVGGEGPGVVLALGSLYLAGEVLALRGEPCDLAWDPAG